MGNSLRVIGKFITGILLIIFLIGFVAIYSVSQNVHADNVEEIFIQASEDFVQEKIDESSEGASEEDLALIYNELIQKCEGQEQVDFEDIIFGLDCADIEAAGVDGVEDVLKGKFNEKIRGQIESEIGDAGVYDYISVFKVITWAFLIVTIVLIVLFFIFNFPRSTFFIPLGFVLIISGLPFLVALFSDYSSAVSDVPALQQLVNELSRSIYVNFLIVFISGIVVLITGIIVRLSMMKKEDNTKDKPKDGKKKEKS